MPLIDEPFSFNYFGHTITARSLGTGAIPDISTITSVHVVPIANDGNIVAINVINRGWDIPGGHVDEGESSPLDALRREALEEANVSLLEPVLVDVLMLESETLDISTKPYLLMYAAEIWELNTFTPNNEVSQRLLMTAKMFVDSYFGNKTYAKAMVDASVSALAPNRCQVMAAAQSNTNSLSTNRSATPKKSKILKKRLITLAIIAAILLFNFPLLHMIYVKTRLTTVSLPLSNQVASMGGNGLGPSGTNISFTVNKSYANTIEAKRDIIQKLDTAGISILKPGDEPTYTFVQDDTQSGGELPGEEIEMTFFPDYHIFTFELEPPAPCSPSSVPGNDKALCDDQLKGEEYKNRLLNTRPVSSVRVHASVKF